MKMRRADTRLRGEHGQSTVEAALVIPILFIMALLLLQPAIMLYDRIVMSEAAAEGCRLLATKTDELGSMDGSCEAFIRHRLAAIPPQDCFHVHDGGCTWGIVSEGDESAQTVTVTISNEIRPLPLFDGAATLLGMTNGAGHVAITVSKSAPVQPAWVASTSAGINPQNWIGAWCA